jgi:hypothetical protein
MKKASGKYPSDAFFIYKSGHSFFSVNIDKLDGMGIQHVYLPPAVEEII